MIGGAEVKAGMAYLDALSKAWEAPSGPDKARTVLGLSAAALEYWGHLLAVVTTPEEAFAVAVALDGITAGVRNAGRMLR
jgi:hypothetical protein